MAKGDFMQAIKTGAWVTATILVLNWILSYANLAPRELFGITPATGITTTAGTKVIAILQNLVGLDIMSVLALLISAILVVYLGELAIDKLKLPDGKSRWQKMALTLFYGTIPFYILFVGLWKLPAWGTLVGLGVWYIGVALVLGGLQKLKVKIL